MHMDMKYSHVIQGRESSTPFSGTLEIDIHNVDRYKDPEILFYAKYEHFIISYILAQRRNVSYTKNKICPMLDYSQTCLKQAP